VEDHPQERVACFFSHLAQVTRSCQYNRVGVSPIPRKNPYSFSVVIRRDKPTQGANVAPSDLGNNLENKRPC
jgi:hypothetical protein